jgi:IclR family transcriptional regulator, pca regulon regulatory protein
MTPPPRSPSGLSSNDPLHPRGDHNGDEDHDVTSEESQRGTDFVASLERGLSVIRAFGADHPSLSLSDVARATGLSRASARRFLHTLVALGYVRSDGRLFSLRPQILELGYAYLSSVTLPEITQPHLRALSDEVGESSSVSVLEPPDVVYIARASVRRIVRISINVGTRYPAFATSMGRVLLADQPDEWLDEYLKNAFMEPLTPRTITDADHLRQVLARVAKDGYAIVDQEIEVGLRSIAVPIRDPEGTVVAAMNIPTPAAAWTSQRLRTELLPALRRTAGKIEADLRDMGTSAPR